jgi:hypothetical protein
LRLLSLVFAHADIVPDDGAQRESVYRHCGRHAGRVASARKAGPSQSLEDAFVSWSDAPAYERRIREVTMKHMARTVLARTALARTALARTALALAALAVAASSAFFPIGTAMAQSCETQAVSATGKPLHGAAKNSFVKKCKKDACESKAVSAEGKPLHGAAKNSFMAKCKRDA